MRPLALLLLGVAGCSQDGGAAPSDLAQDIPDLLPLACNGTFRNSLNGDFSRCQLQVTFAPDAQVLRIIPRTWIPLQGQPMPSRILINFLVKPAWQLRTYTLDMLSDGTFIEIVSGSNTARFFAGRVVDDMTQQRMMGGTIELILRALPVDPMTGMDWYDTNVHGSLTASAPLDPNTPGNPAIDRVDVAFEF